MDCIFCKLVDGSVSTKKIYEDEQILAFEDLSPQAPVHVLVIPKAHISNTNALNEENSAVVAHIFATIPKIAQKMDLSNGYRVVNNCGPDGGQTVFHLHFHILGGKKLNTTMA
ncbi:MAG TPA: histidine triad nucleotide-binding protein [Candidatus Scatavimonas merdigallinarum]|uniref:Histidine triad nucleotide-binding protein n=1 Tax=Candidatus Scatavimonas merdigallinarum TaxID=2840914 RepID=A0A9D0ZI78_9FIRM|nr:histidine triad nucleotide-binding protein [Candidatus Scatavimonas merdigallinarum]